jgi:hypothetical protein
MIHSPYDRALVRCGDDSSFVDSIESSIQLELIRCLDKVLQFILNVDSIDQFQLLNIENEK